MRPHPTTYDAPNHSGVHMGELDLSNQPCGNLGLALGGDRYSPACMCPFKVYAFKNDVIFVGFFILVMPIVGLHLALRPT